MAPHLRSIRRLATRWREAERFVVPDVIQQQAPLDIWLARPPRPLTHTPSRRSRQPSLTRLSTEPVVTDVHDVLEGAVVLVVSWTKYLSIMACQRVFTAGSGTYPAAFDTAAAAGSCSE